MDHVQVLLLLHKSEPDEWDPGTAAAEAKLASEIAEVALNDLEAAGLASSVQRGAVRAYRFRPASPALRSDVDELARMYNERPVTLIRALYDRAPDPAASFADAFTLKREEK